MDVYQPDRKPRGRARQRMAARQRRQMVTPRAPEAGVPLDTRTPLQRRDASPPGFRAPRLNTGGKAGDIAAKAGAAGRDLLWRLRNDVRFTGIAAAVVAALFLIFVLTYTGQNRIFPNVWALGVNLGGKTVDESIALLQQAWSSEVRIQVVDEERQWELTPTELGIRLDARATAESARNVGMSGIPLGYHIVPAVALDVLAAQTTLLNYTEISRIVPHNAGYRWEGDELVGIPGTDGRFLDVAITLENLQEDLEQVADRRRLDLVMMPMEPDITDPTPYLEQARALTSQTFLVRAYDPFTNETLAWTPDRDTFTSWIEAGTERLSLRAEEFAQFVDMQTDTLMQDDDLRYIEPSDALDKVRTAIGEGRAQVTLRIRYRTSTYEVQSGDSGYRIARRTGVPFNLMQQANPRRDWDAMLSVGERVNLPSPDEVVPLDPVPNKRIIVDLETQTLWAYENGQLVFNWLISSGMDRAPTSPGIFQILDHQETAVGSSVELCGDNSCGSWTMGWFMGIYEVSPGLVNGFHGRVILPGGTVMGNGNVGSQYTYGCVMSIDGDAEQLYYWAEVGTMVEIVSREYAPRSDLARMSLGQNAQAADAMTSSNS